MKSLEELKDAADRAFELLEQKSPHQLAVELVSMEDRVQGAIDACARMQEQRDQLAFQLEDATRQCRVMAEVLRDAFAYIDDDQDHSIETGKPLPDNCVSLLSRIDAALAGKLPKPLVPEGWQLVPVVPGESMCEAGASVQCRNLQSEADWIAGVYGSMLDAAPKP